MLCDLLEETGVAGKPGSFFRRQSMREYGQRWGLHSAGDALEYQRQYLHAATVAGRGDGNVFGLRLMPDHHMELQRLLRLLYPKAADDLQRLSMAFGAVCFIYLERADSVAQAISRYRAEQSGLWHRHADGSERERVKPPAQAEYSYHAIAHHLQGVERDKRIWRTWFDKHAVVPVSVSYEALAGDPTVVIGKLLDNLSLDSVAATGIKPRTAKLADKMTDRWYRRFIDDNK